MDRQGGKLVDWNSRIRKLIVGVVLLATLSAATVSAQSSAPGRWVQGCYVWGPIRSITTNLEWCAWWRAPLYWFWVSN